MNRALYLAIHEIYVSESEVLAREENVHSEEFLASFPRAFLRKPDEWQSDLLREQTVRLRRAAFDSSIDERMRSSLAAFAPDGSTVESQLLRVVEDFLNYAIPRCVGLRNQSERFDGLYNQFEEDLLGDEFTLESIATIEGIRDHGSNYRSSGGVDFRWVYSREPLAADTPESRDRVVPFFEFSKRAQPAPGGRSITNNTSLFLLHVRERVPKRPDAMRYASARANDVTRKVIFLLRLLTQAPIFSDFWSFRAVGRLSGFGMFVMNEPSRVIGGFSSSHDLMTYSLGFAALIPYVLDKPYSAIEVLDLKIEDSLRRERNHWTGANVEKQVEIDRLLDYFQALESLLPTPNSYQTSLLASAILGAHLKDSGKTSAAIFAFIRAQYKLRNDVMHGRIDDVLAGEGLDIPQLRTVVHKLAILKILNEGSSLKTLGEGLLLRQDVRDAAPQFRVD